MKMRNYFKVCKQCVKIKKEVVTVLKGRLEQARMEAGLTQPQLAKLLGKSRTWLSFRENAKRKLYRNDLEKIAKLAHKPLSWFSHADPEKENLLWKAKQYDRLIKEVEKFYTATRAKHYTELTDDEIDQEFERLGITDVRFKPFLKAIPVLTEKEKQKILRSFRNTNSCF
jgi:transcriptional regulator with XRE-family HTH domain